MSLDLWDQTYLGRYRAKPLRVLDPNTFTAVIDLGEDVHITRMVTIADRELPDGRDQAYSDSKLRLASVLPAPWSTYVWGDWPLRLHVKSRDETTLYSDVLIADQRNDRFIDLRDALDD